MVVVFLNVHFSKSINVVSLVFFIALHVIFGAIFARFFFGRLNYFIFPAC